MSGDPFGVSKAGKDGKYNGQVATPSGAQTYAPKKDHHDRIDSAKVGSKEGLKKKD